MDNSKYIRGRRPKPCFNCGVPGHTVKLCRGPRRLVCNICYKVGYVRQTCPLAAQPVVVRSFPRAYQEKLKTEKPIGIIERRSNTNLGLSPKRDAGLIPIFSREPDSNKNSEENSETEQASIPE
ncbi:hypothetical protein KQX54_007494 [Cotesia glomerata]|uniref:CCHC-type domain-containing protein n=1 Tax=Cotesia glomerata TaxID=32391 RepID=A0AAV7IPY8_COTGL|nr:hypothetical protein KQX54_007494 [Cotesia glomerata]